MRFCQPLDARDLFAFLFGVHDVDSQVRPIEAADKRVGFNQAELLDDVGTNVGRGGGGEGNGLNAASKRFDYRLQAQVVGTKVVAPGRDAMRFVNRKERNTDGLQRFEKTAAAKAFRRDVDELEVAAAQGFDARPLFALGQWNCL